MACCPEGGGGDRTGSKGGIPPPPQVKNGRDPADPPPAKKNWHPPVGYQNMFLFPAQRMVFPTEIRFVILPGFGAFAYPPARSSLRWRPPACLKTSGIPPPPQVKNGRDPADPPPKTGKMSSLDPTLHDGEVKQWDLFIMAQGGGMPIVALHSRHTPTYPVLVGGMALVPEGGGGRSRGIM